MGNDRVIAAIDIGTTKICTLVGGRGRGGETEILGVGVAPARGLKKGSIVDLDATVGSVVASIEKAERTSGFKIVSAYVGISGDHIRSQNNRGVIAITHPDRVITLDDSTRVIESARAIPIPSNRELIHIIPRSYTVDGQEGVKNPIGMHGFRLEVETHLISGATTSIQNLTKCVNLAGVDVDDLVLQPLASAEAVLSEEEKEMGVLLADIGGGTTDVALFVDGAVWHTSCLPVGGWHLSNDIAVTLRTSFQVAEELKARYAQAQPRLVPPNDLIDLPAFGAEEKRQESRRHLCEIVEARVDDILQMIIADVKRSGYDGLLPAGIVLTGGSANLVGIDAFAREAYRMPVRVGRPRRLRGLTDTVSDPAYATSVGLLLWGLRASEVDSRTAHPAKRRSGGAALARRLIGWARELLPS
ncbi:MAG: cell division protein FtsA [Chloroflexota bacterium]|nr:cell division protein FtsA [Dehalococcoidia bacterium]MDW8253169.1 cell division protein FtsA [Chloroflexota bacterium]